MYQKGGGSHSFSWKKKNQKELERLPRNWKPTDTQSNRVTFSFDAFLFQKKSMAT
jgi:hypothetical protein